MKPPPEPRNREELLKMFEDNIKASRAALEKVSEEELLKPWSFLNGGKTVFSAVKVAVLRGMVMNHMIHHRGQLTVYLRLNDVPVPALYGPSADEGSFQG